MWVSSSAAEVERRSRETWADWGMELMEVPPEIRPGLKVVRCSAWARGR